MIGQMGVHADDHVVDERHFLEQADVLEGSGDAALRDAMGGDALQAASVELEEAAGGREQAGDEVEHRGFPGTVGADEPIDLLRMHRQRDVVQGANPAELAR